MPWLDKVVAAGGISLEKAAGIWPGLAVNQRLKKRGTAHRDQNDTSRGPNCVVPYGNWSGGDVLLWKIR